MFFFSKLVRGVLTLMVVGFSLVSETDEADENGRENDAPKPGHLKGVTKLKERLSSICSQGLPPPDAGIFIFRLGKANPLIDNRKCLMRDLLKRHAARSRLSRLD